MTVEHIREQVWGWVVAVVDGAHALAAHAGSTLIDLIHLAEDHPNLASWAQAVGALAAIWVAFRVSREQFRQSLRLRRQDRIDVLDVMIALVEDARRLTVVTYEALNLGDPKLFLFSQSERYRIKHVVSAMKSITVDKMPSAPAYTALQGSLHLLDAMNQELDMFANTITADPTFNIKVMQIYRGHESAYDEPLNTLKSERKRLARS